MDCSNSKKKFWRKTIKHYIVEAFGSQCNICKQSFEDCCYDLHHINPNEKDFTISNYQFNGAKTWLKIRDEVKKCCLVCANCHRLIHNNFITIPNQQYFNEEYYNWDLTNYTQVNEELIPSYRTSICPQCGGPKTPTANLCSNCALKLQKKFEISREELKNLIYKLPMTKIGERFGVSDNAIRHRCKTFGLPTRKSDIKKYTLEEWEKL